MKASKIINILSLSVLLTFVSSCTTVDYVGESYPATQDVQIYYSLEEVPEEYRIFGHLVGTGGIFSTENERFEKLKLEGMARGADAIVITGIDIENGDDLDETKKINASLIKYIE